MMSKQRVRRWIECYRHLHMRLKTQRHPFWKVVTFSIIFFVGYWLYSRNRSALHPTSAIGCKNKIAQIVLPVKADRDQYLLGFDKDKESLENDYYKIVEHSTKMCYHQMTLGAEGDGGWDVCLDGKFDIQAPCLVYSFGVNFDFRFERAIEQEFKCEVHAFDPSMNMDSYKFSERGYFHNIGIDNEDSYTSVTRWKMRRIETIIKDLGHVGRTIDYLKMDVEFSEWPALYDMLQSGFAKRFVRQMAFETHTAEMDIHTRQAHACTWSTRESLAFSLRTLIELRNSGFQLYYTRTNYRTQFQSRLTGHERCCCHNLHFVNSAHQKHRW